MNVLEFLYEYWLRNMLLIAILLPISISCSLTKVLNFEIPQSLCSIPEIRIEHMAYTVSYNPENNNPNWGAWN